MFIFTKQAIFSLLGFGIFLYVFLEIIKSIKSKKEKEFNRYFGFLVRQEEMRLSTGEVKSNFQQQQNKKKSKFQNEDVDQLITKLEWGSNGEWNKECATLAKELKLNLGGNNYTQTTQFLLQHFADKIDKDINRKRLALLCFNLTPFYNAIIQNKKIRANTPKGSITNDGISLHFLINSRDINFESNFNYLAQKLSQKDRNDYINQFVLNRDFNYEDWINYSILAESINSPFSDDMDEDIKALFPDKTKKGVKNSFKKLAKKYHPDKVNLSILPEQYHEEVKEIVSGYFKKLNDLKDKATQSA